MSTGERHPRNPYLTVDALLLDEQELLAIERANHPHGWALPGGFVDYGETTENAVKREVREELGVDFFNPKLFNVYSEPDRDPRQHNVTICYWGTFEGSPEASSDARSVKPFNLNGPWPEFVFDHHRIVSEFVEFLDGRNCSDEGGSS